MKNTFLILALLISSISFSQKTKSEFLTLRVQYNITSTGIGNSVSVDIGNLKSHTFYENLSNEDGVVIIDEIEYISEIDLLNYFGNIGWTIFETRTQIIMSQTYYTYLLIKK